MNILLVKPWYPYPYSRGDYTYNRIWPPLCLVNCAALLEKEGYNVKILDAHAQRIKPSKIVNYIKNYDKIFITSSSLDKWQCPNIDIASFIDTARYAKALNDEVYVMGYHGTVEPERVLELTGAKTVIRGEPEYTVLEISQGKKLSEIKGITFRENGKFVHTEQRDPLDLKKLLIPSFHLLDFRRYFYEILGTRFSLFEINRGCRFQCRFCNKVMYGEGVRNKSIKQILEEVTIAIEKYNVRTGYFIDLDFLSNREIVEKLCEYLIKKKYKFKWTCQTRPDLVDIEILKEMKKAGCEIIHLGIETGSEILLNYLNKNVAIDRIKQTIKICHGVGIKTLVFLLFGLPRETDKDRNQNFKFIKDLNPDFVSFHKLFPYKGSDIDKDSFDSEDCLDKFIQQAFIKYYLRPSYLFRANPFVTLKGLNLFWKRIRTLK